MFQVSNGLPLGNQKSSGQSKKKQLRSSVNRAAVNINSSPVIGSHQPPAFDVADSIEPQLPTLADQDLNEDNIQNVHSAAGQYPNNRREVFRMIESIRSSSPANTPSNLGYDTPVHLRKLTRPRGTTNIPLTPTLAPTENDEGYIGSSPTPATRDPTPALNTDATSRPQEVAMPDAIDLPSSPPELSSMSPSPQKRANRSRRERTRSAKARKAIHQRSLDAESASNSPVKADPIAKESTEPNRAVVQTDPKENNDASRLDERPPSRRLRSALSQSTDNERNLAPTPSFGTPDKDAGTLPVEQNSKSKPSFKRKKRKSSNAANEDAPDVPRCVSRFPPPVRGELVDSSSEDVENQIASQLEQDLELAMDMSGDVPEQSVERPTSATSSRKRKREADDARPSMSKERRRSARRSTTKDMALGDAEEPDIAQSQYTPQASQNIAPEQFTSPALRRSTRGSQRKEEDVAPPVAPPVNQVSESSQELDKEQSSSQPPAKRTRKSLGEDKSETVTEEPSNQIKSTRSRSRSRSRNARPSQNEIEPQPQPPQTATIDAEIAPADINLLDDSDDAAQDVVPESFSQQKDVPEQLVSLISTEEATDSQMTDIGPSTSSGPASADNRMDVEDQGPTHVHPVLQHVTTATEIQTVPTPPTSEPGPSHTGITHSLKKILDSMKLAVLGPQALREVDDLLFNIRVEAHEASRRHNSA